MPLKSGMNYALNNNVKLVLDHKDEVTHNLQ